MTGSSNSLGHSLMQAARFWEPLRIRYNLALVAVVAAWVVATWPHFREALRLASLPPMAALALIANLCYCSAYLVDIPLQRTARPFVERGRWIVWGAGTLLAIGLSSYWIVDEIYPDFH